MSEGELPSRLLALARRDLRAAELLRDQEDRAILLQWLEKRAAGGGVKMISLEELEQDLAADGLL